MQKTEGRNSTEKKGDRNTSLTSNTSQSVMSPFVFLHSCKRCSCDGREGNIKLGESLELLYETLTRMNGKVGLSNAFRIIRALVEEKSVSKSSKKKVAVVFTHYSLLT